MSGLREAVRNLNARIDDLSSLHVQTYTGEVSVDLGGDGQTGIDNVRAAVTSARTNGNVTLVAEAYYRFDGDSYNFVTSDTGIPPDALELHKAAVESGIRTRLGLMELVRSVFD